MCSFTEGLPPLVKLLHTDNGEVKEAITLALANLTSSNIPNCQWVAWVCMSAGMQWIKMAAFYFKLSFILFDVDLNMACR